MKRGPLREHTPVAVGQHLPLFTTPTPLSWRQLAAQRRKPGVRWPLLAGGDRELPAPGLLLSTSLMPFSGLQLPQASGCPAQAGRCQAAGRHTPGLYTSWDKSSRKRFQLALPGPALIRWALAIRQGTAHKRRNSIESKS